MIFRRKPKLSRDDALSARPVRLVKADVQRRDDGARITVPLTQRGWLARLMPLPPGASKSFEFDAIGCLVWELCDGSHSVRQIVRRIAGEYRLNPREAEVASLRFLQTLMRKGLVGLPVMPEKR